MGIACLFGHKWNGCKCERCGETRDEQHDWGGCRCIKCGKNRDEQHNWDGLNCSVCHKSRSVKEISDQFLLAKIAKNDNYPFDTRIAALHEINNMSLLEDIIKHEDNTFEVRLAALEKVNDYSTLIRIAKNDKEVAAYVRVAAAKKADDQNTLADIAKKYGWEGESALKELNDPKLIADVAKKAKLKGVRQKAVAKLTDRAIINDVLSNGEYHDVIVEAYKKIPENRPYVCLIEGLGDGQFDTRKEAAEELIVIAETKPEALLPIWDWIKKTIEIPYSQGERLNTYDREEAGLYSDSGIGLKFPTKPKSI